ncbi:AbrB family transcriptional regulator [Halegenticoccus soli]|uniref:AbrB family transcriptional regulator n=1 Tax=Halegenticoccus soli TaxID=1985678 RepID=UPI000C6E5AC2|nr:AbrB family transcriptional regulator [Halegenticoccus soli]
MPRDPIERETAVGEDYSVAVPPAVREAGAVAPGDRLRWVVGRYGDVTVEVVGRSDEGATYDNFDHVSGEALDEQEFAGEEP